MLGKIKKLLYFPIAYYFRFFAKIQLSRWKPRVIVVTGSSGKTTLLHMVETQLGNLAKYSHHANSAYGIPFDILGLKRNELLITEWPILFLLAPFKAFKKPYPEKLYVVEADCDRPGEGKFLASLLNPEVTLWVGSSRTHSMNFDKLVANKEFPSVEEAIAHEFGHFLEYTTRKVMVNGDSSLLTRELHRTKTQIINIKKAEKLESYELGHSNTKFKIGGKEYEINALLPEETFYSLAMANELLKYLDITPVPYSNFKLPPGRSSVFSGVKNTTLIDSSYNANLDSMTVILNMFDKYPANNKWAVLGDMLEQGKEEKEEHEKLAELVAQVGLSNIILMGPRVSEYTYPKLKSLLGDASKIEKFTTPREILDYLNNHLTGREIILFKGARFLEGVVEHLLADRSDASKLCRREKVWQIRRKQWQI